MHEFKISKISIPKITNEEISKVSLVPDFLNNQNKEEVETIAETAKNSGQSIRIEDINLEIKNKRAEIESIGEKLEKIEKEKLLLEKLIKEEGKTSYLLNKLDQQDITIKNLKLLIRRREKEIRNLNNHIDQNLINAN